MEKLKLLKQFQHRRPRAGIIAGYYVFLTLLFIAPNAFAKEHPQAELTLSFKDAKLETIISFIEKKTAYRFFYQTPNIDLKKKMSVHYKGKISSAIHILFHNTSISPVIANKQVILKSKRRFEQRVISGRVVDVDGIPLPSVNVYVNDFERGTTTDKDGYYKVLAKEGDKIFFSFIGFKEQNVIVGSSDVINVTLKEDTELLDEVVLVGYGEKERSKVSAAIGTIDGEEIQEDIQSGTSFDRSLSGLLKGVKIIQGGGKPGTGVDINIRGYTSPFANSANNPLFIIDNVPVQVKGSFGSQTNILASINPNDIESLSVLKDAAATSIYGSRGANGVIIIKTKKGIRNQDLQFNLSVRTTFSRPIRTLNYLGLQGYKNYISKLITNSMEVGNSLEPGSSQWGQIAGGFMGLANFGAVVDFSNPTNAFAYDPSRAKYGSGNTNWSDVVYRNVAHTQEYGASLSGGGNKTSYGFSLRYLNQEGLLKADKYEQYNVRLNFSIMPNEKWDIGTNINLGFSKNKSGYIGINQNLNGLLAVRPDIPVYDENGEITTYTGLYSTNYANPLGMTTKNDVKNNNKSITGNMYIQYEILSGLKLKGSFNIGHFLIDRNSFASGKYQSLGFYPNFISDNTTLTLSESSNTNLVTDFTIHYLKTFNERHTLGLTAGVNKTDDFTSNLENSYDGFASDVLKFPQYANNKRTSSFTPDFYWLNSYIGRVSYDYDGKYNVTATLRLDKTSQFSPKKRNAWFPSIAASWNIHDENFIGNTDKINQLKLRASYGKTGSTNVPSFSFVQQFLAGSQYNGKTAIGPSKTLANPDAGWEETNELNLGLDFGFLRNRIMGSIDVYQRTTKGALIESPRVLETGATSFTSNFANINNNGIELDLSFDIISNENFHWTVALNASKNVNKLISFDASFVDPGFEDTYEVGKEINLIKGYVVEGIYKNQQEIDQLNAIASERGHSTYDPSGVGPGDYRMKDINNDGRITSADRTNIGSSQPDLFGGFRTNFGYKGFTLGFAFNYSLGSEMIRSVQAVSDPSPHVNIEQQYAPEHRWSPTNTNAKLPRLIIGTYHNGRLSTANVLDASYLRCKVIRFGYNLPYDLAGKLRLSNVNFYISGNNLYTWTKFTGLDPEGTFGGAFAGSTSSRDPYPISKSFTFGIDVKF